MQGRVDTFEQASVDEMCVMHAVLCMSDAQEVMHDKSRRSPVCGLHFAHEVQVLGEYVCDKWQPVLLLKHPKLC